MSISDIDKYLRAKKQVKAFEYPPETDTGADLSPEVRTVSKGEVLGRINSFLPSEYYEVVTKEEKQADRLFSSFTFGIADVPKRERTWYVKKSEKTQAIESKEADRSNIFARWWNQTADVIDNYTNSTKRYAEHLQSGFKESVSGVTDFGLGLGNIVLIAGGMLIALFAFIFLIQITD